VIAFAAADLGASTDIPVYVFTLVTLMAGITSALKGRYGWLAFGVFGVGVPWLVSSVMLAKPGSAWATALYGPEKLARAERRASRRRLSVRA
jgi:hypothetical protein